MIKLQNDQYTITINDVSSMGAGTSTYSKQHVIGESHYVTRSYEVIINENKIIKSTCLIVAEGNGSSLNNNSATIHNENLIIAIGAFICSISLTSLQLNWYVRADMDICFGVYLLPNQNGYISHGEQDIARIATNGILIWSTSGKDIFTNGFKLSEDFVEAIDFNNEKHIINIETGESKVI